jgi:uncharacterized protein YndB with AHSA1/START domain
MAETPVVPQHHHDTATSTPDDLQIRTERSFDAPRAKVWRAFTDATTIARWWGSGYEVNVELFEVKPGGHWRFVLHRGREQYGMGGEFRDVKEPERLVLTLEWSELPGIVADCTVSFEEIDGNRTRIVALTRYQSKEERDAMLRAAVQPGLNGGYDALDEVLRKAA